MTPKILTQRLRLSPLLASDAMALFEYRSDPMVCQYQSFEPGTLDDAQKFISSLHFIAFDTPDTWFQFGIRLRESDLLVGDLGVHFMMNRAKSRSASQ